MFSTLIKHVKGYTKASILTPLFMVLEVIFETIIPICMGKIVTFGIEGNNGAGDMDYILKMGGIMTVLVILAFVSGILGAVYGSVASTGLAKNLRRDMYKNIQTFSFSNIDKFSTAGLITRMTTDVTNVQNAYQMLLRLAFRAPVSMIFAMIMSYLVSVKIANIYLVAVIFLSIGLGIIMLNARKYFTRVFEKYDDLNETIQENVNAIRVVKAFVREDYESEELKKAAGNIYKMFVKAENVVIWNSPLMQFTMYTTMIIISWIGAHMVISNELDTGSLLTLFTYCLNILGNLMMVSFIFVMLTLSAASAKRIAEVLDENPALSNPENPVFDVKDGSVQFKDVCFSYKKDGSGKNVLNNINLDIKSGETIGVIGGTGSAKTSLVNLIDRLYDVTEGEILVGGVNVKDYDMEALRNQVSVVLQKNVLFAGSIYDNLRWGNPEATEEECREACKLACADGFITAFPEGYETKIEQGGTNVSGGQKQRLCIARALLKKPKIIIFDDSTSAVDTATDANIRKALRDAIPGTTKFIIAQRISSVSDADRIIVMEDGEVNGFGTHDELLKNNDIYREVYESQTGANADFDEAKGGVD
ncbi:MAG: ABC transporter ATP-binding protein/permease [Lachnospiraceae bacterium]|nr:ABC transporter ATP-binding protein/permease [Lachnospiraceae bacterium]